MAELELDHVTKSFGRTGVIEGIDLAVEDGELIVIVGPSGCGKSTLLRMVAGLEAVSGGEIRIAGKRVNELEPMDRNIAMVFQNYALYPHMSVFDNMAYGLKIARMERTEIRRRVSEAAEMLELAALLDRKPRQLSGGQRQRVAMGRAIVRDPVIFLFDEPLSNLDAKLRVLMRLEIKSLQRKLGTTSLYVTHDQIEAMTLADRMVVMNEGRAEQIGTPLDVYQRPASQFAAQFIGSPAMNIFPAELHDGDLRLENGAILKSDSRAKGSVLAGIRPEHMIPAAEGNLRMTVEMSEPVGANTLLHGRLKDSNQPLVASVQGVFVSASGKVEQCFDIAPESVHLFDPATGKRLETG